MLILTRRPGESIHIGGNTKVKVLEVRGRQVQIGIEAPQDVAIQREEIIGREAPKKEPHGQ